MADGYGPITAYGDGWLNEREGSRDEEEGYRISFSVIYLHVIGASSFPTAQQSVKHYVSFIKGTGDLHNTI